MKGKSIAILKELFETEEISEESIIQLKEDERKGVQQLIKTYENKKRKNKILENNFVKMCQYEEKSYLKGRQYIAGIDEAGRGPLAGPVVAAAVILPRDFKLVGLTDSKQLSEKSRNKFYKIIVEQAVSYAVSIIDNKEIDQINIFEATKRAMRGSLDQLDRKPDHVLIDAVELNQLGYTSESIIKGDQKSITIAAASIVAKVTRDRIMYDIHKEFPLYDFSSNMGYGTKNHVEMLEEHGITPYHRKSFAPVRNVINR